MAFNGTSTVPLIDRLPNLSCLLGYVGFECPLNLRYFLFLKDKLIRQQIKELPANAVEMLYTMWSERFQPQKFLTLIKKICTFLQLLQQKE